MAAYPSHAQLIGSTEEWVDDVVLDRSVSGTVKARGFFTAKKRRFSVRHVLGATDRGTFQTFYNANRLLAVTFTWTGDGVTYTCLIEGPPRYVYIGNGWTDVDVKLIEQ